MTRATLDTETHYSELERFIELAWFRRTILALIIINAVLLGVLTYRVQLADWFVTSLEILDHGITAVFVLEIGLKLIVYRMKFFKLGWNWFDFIVVGVSLVPGGSAFGVLRAMRVLRVLRLLRVIPTMRHIVEALMKALPGIGAVVAVLALVIYVGAVMTTNMYGDTDNPEVALMFGDLPRSAFSLFQVMTMDGWRFEVVQKVIDDGNPYAWIFFLIFILIASFAILNLFIALLVESLQTEQRALMEEGLDEIEDELEEEFSEAVGEREQMMAMMKEMKEELQALKQAIERKS